MFVFYCLYLYNKYTKNNINNINNIKKMGRKCEIETTDEELMEWIKSKKTCKELRADSYAFYQRCIKRGLNVHFPGKHKKKKDKWTDEELIEWCKSFQTRKSMREADYSRYLMILKRELKQHLPPKMTRCGNTVGQIKEKKKREPKEPKTPKKVDESTPEEKKWMKMYNGMDYGDGNILCGRCLEIKPKKKGLICYTCAKVIVSNNSKGLDTNKFNVKDYFVNTKITDGGKVFYIGTRVDERTQDYLTKLGYGFMFKEEYSV